MLPNPGLGQLTCKTSLTRLHGQAMVDVMMKVAVQQAVVTEVMCIV